MFGRKVESQNTAYRRISDLCQKFAADQGFDILKLEVEETFPLTAGNSWDIRISMRQKKKS